MRKRLFPYFTAVYIALASVLPVSAADSELVRTVRIFVDEHGQYKDNGLEYGEARTFTFPIRDKKSGKIARDLDVASVLKQRVKILVVTRKIPDPETGQFSLKSLIDSSDYSKEGIDGVVDAASKWEFNHITGKYEWVQMDLSDPQQREEAQEAYDLGIEDSYNFIVIGV